VGTTIRIWGDFETRSYNDLQKSGANVYSEHPSTGVVCLAYEIDNWGMQWWVPPEAALDWADEKNWTPWDGKGINYRAMGMPSILGERPHAYGWSTRRCTASTQGMPIDLYQAIVHGAHVEVHNYSFEYSIWANVMVARYGWVPIKDEQWRDTMAVACYYALPAKLDQLARALKFQGKDSKGGGLISKYSKLNLKTAKPLIPIEDLEAFVTYCTQDVKVEQAISDYLGDLPDEEQAMFLLDLKMNTRGLYLDGPGIEAATAVVEDRSEKLQTEFRGLTGLNPTQRDKCMEWFGGQGLKLDNMTADYLEELLEEGEVPQGPARRALEIRLAINKASTKKLDAMARNRGRNGRARFQSRYHGAQTGRPTGSGFQPLNLNRGMEDVDPDQLVRDIMHKDPAWLDALYSEVDKKTGRVSGGAMDAVGKASRHWIMAEPGNRIIAGDLVSIEAVILACLAGEEWKVEAFRQGKKIYELMGDVIYGLPEGTVTKATHPTERQDGKTCLAAGTKVLTQNGWKRIVEVERSDRLWDGGSWVSHGGLVCQGVREVLILQGVEMTPDHLVLAGETWVEAWRALSCEAYRCRARETGLASLRSSGRRSAKGEASSPFGSSVLAGPEGTSWPNPTYAKGGLLGASNARPARPRYGEKTSGVSPTCAPTTTTAAGCLIAFLRALLGVAPGGMRTTGGGASECLSLGLGGRKGSVSFWGISCLSLGGISRNLKLTASRWVETTRRAIFGSSPEPKTRPTKGKSETCNAESRGLKLVYDIANAGPLRRFTIQTDAGALVVHNCELAFGYQGALGAWLKFDSSGRHTDERILEICRTWRSKHPMVIGLWRGLENTAIQAVQCPDHNLYTYRQIGYQVVDDWLSCILPDGKKIWYYEPELRVGMPAWHRPELKEDCAAGTCSCKPGPKLSYMAQKEGQWRRVYTYGGKLAENTTQATSRQVLKPILKRIEAAGYPIVLTVYDEVVCEVSEGFGAKEEFQKLMTASPGDWAKDWPIKVDVWEGGRYRK